MAWHLATVLRRRPGNSPRAAPVLVHLVPAQDTGPSDRESATAGAFLLRLGAIYRAPDARDALAEEGQLLNTVRLPTEEVLPPAL